MNNFEKEQDLNRKPAKVINMAWELYKQIHHSIIEDNQYNFVQDEVHNKTKSNKSMNRCFKNVSREIGMKMNKVAKKRHR